MHAARDLMHLVLWSTDRADSMHIGVKGAVSTGNSVLQHARVEIWEAYLPNVITSRLLSKYRTCI